MIYAFGSRRLVWPYGLAADPLWDLLAQATQRVSVFEIVTSLGSAGTVGNGLTLARTTTVGVQLGAERGVAEGDVSAVSLATAAMSWSTLPIPSNNVLRRTIFSSTQGAGVIFSFPKGLSIPASGSIALSNAVAIGASGGPIWFVNAVINE